MHRVLAITHAHLTGLEPAVIGEDDVEDWDSDECEGHSVRPALLQPNPNPKP